MHGGRLHALLHDALMLNVGGRVVDGHVMAVVGLWSLRDHHGIDSVVDLIQHLAATIRSCHSARYRRVELISIGGFGSTAVEIKIIVGVVAGVGEKHSIGRGRFRTQLISVCTATVRG